MKFIPILFSTPMVQAILDGHKTQTRRTNSLNDVIGHTFTGLIEFQGNLHAVFIKDNIQTLVKCPYGQPGDILWVREKFKVIGWSWEDDEMTIQYATGETESIDSSDIDWIFSYVEKLVAKDIYMPGNPEDDQPEDEVPLIPTGKNHPFTPSIHMPKWACRIFLRVKSVRVERLQDISEQDAISEGIKQIGNDLEFGGTMYPGAWFNNYGPAGYSFLRPVESFRTLWESINGPDSWNENPWLWVIEFERIEKPEIWPA